MVQPPEGSTVVGGQHPHSSIADREHTEEDHEEEEKHVEIPGGCHPEHGLGRAVEVAHNIHSNVE